MYNINSLNDVEFEYLCQDIMQKKLNIELHRFAAGADGGIDLTDSIKRKNIVIQVKHYVKSSSDALKRDLKKELDKVKKFNPKQYYICFSKEVSPMFKDEIFIHFREYMASDNNIITGTEIIDFLEDTSNFDILFKHYKLWLSSSAVLSKIQNQDVVIDSEMYLDDIETDARLFVQTQSFNICLDCIEQTRKLFILGEPGIGKSILTKMLALKYLSVGYKVYCVYNNSIQSLKKSISRDPAAKELIVLDDSLGQYYFNMQETRENELISLLKYIGAHQNKAIILNSRVTIFNESKRRSLELAKLIDNRGLKVHTINIDNVSMLEKAKILYNHFYFCGIPKEYFDVIKKDKQYLKIIKHPNYNPRIIEYITSNKFIEDNTVDCYGKAILDTLDNPEAVWSDEYNRKLQNIDRILLNTLFSLTDTLIEVETLKYCFEFRLASMTNIDTTIDHFSHAIKRLNKAFIRIIDNKGKKIGVVNPSVNDFLNNQISQNAVELKAMQENIVHINQASKLLRDKSTEFIAEEVKTKNILKYYFNDRDRMLCIIASQICKEEIFDTSYKPYIDEFLSTDFKNSYGSIFILSNTEIIHNLFSQRFVKFYKLENYFNNIDNIKSIIKYQYLGDLIDAVNVLYSCISSLNLTYGQDINVIFAERITEELNYLPYDDELSEYLDNYNISEIISRNACGFDGDINMDKVTDEIENLLIIDLHDYAREITSDLNGEIMSLINFDDLNFSISLSEIEDYVDSFLSIDNYDEDSYHRGSLNVDNSEIDLIFER